ncbi:hypothetical protein ACFOWU_06700 [Epilithonimonas zeae]|uniref:Uncharacterized protein n=1 Tax=Epilithonimonas zeae TaxID=1416779 RepID=A0A1N6FQE0_9FLAO|nr:hypothetical protein [Epilithonimonas zeae]SIN97422.1 hypothetical protein SAMN05444409_1411 [Epilithonimonas zeae]
MKTYLKYDSELQGILIASFLISFILINFLDGDFAMKLIIFEFFMIAIVQYTNNLIKFFSKIYIRTDSRYVYIFLSSYVVIGFIIWALSSIFDINKGSISLKNIFELMAISWLILSPILIIQSLVISYSDKKENYEKPAI